MTSYRPTLLFISFLQALGVAVYCGLVGLIMINGNRLFPMPNNFLGPTVFLLLFVVSAVVCALIFLSYPFFLFWERKQTAQALKLVGLSTAWLVFFIAAFLSLLVVL